MEVLSPAAEFGYSPRVRELFVHLQHAGLLAAGAAREPPSCATESRAGGSRAAPTQMPIVLSASAGSRERGASVTLFIEVRDARMQTIRFQAYGCPHFLAACESLAQWLEGRPVNELSHWRWREAEVELVVPATKRSRLLVLEEVVTQLTGLV